MLFVGLGNPGSRFDNTRHNLGVEVLRAWVEEADSSVSWKSNDLLQAEYVKVSLSDVDSQITALFPTTFMNESGKSVAAFLKQTPLTASDILVIHDELELPLGEVKLTEGGSAKGHNGVRSIQQMIGVEDFPRLRLGIGRPTGEMEVDRFVLGTFAPEEKEVVEEMKKEAVRLLFDLIKS